MAVRVKSSARSIKEHFADLPDPRSTVDRHHLLVEVVVISMCGVLAGAFGLWGREGMAMQIAKILFLVFIVLFIVSLVMGRRAPIDRPASKVCVCEAARP